jgi:hypothetical protein
MGELVQVFKPWHPIDINSLVSKETKSSSRRGCPARKHVERSLEDPSMLVVAYKGEHNHSKIAFQSPSMYLTTKSNHRTIVFSKLELFATAK